MSGLHATRSEAAAKPDRPAAGLMQRACACGTHAHGAAQCPACAGVRAGQAAQRALPIGPPGDRFEREAERVADRIMRSPLPGARESDDHPPSPPAARQPISTLGGGATGSTIPTLPGARGRALDRDTRERMETRFGHDFSRVRVHTGAGAARSAQAVGARAYTVGQHIVFGSGQFAPGSEAGQRLLAHELTHTIQQGDGGRRVQRLVEVSGGASAVNEVLGHFDALCGNGNFATQSGNRITSDCQESSPGCDCLCDVTTNPSKLITIELFSVSNSPASRRLHDGSTETVPMPSEGPRTTSVSSDPTVHIPAAGSTAILFGAFLDNDSPFMANNTRLLAHELCGHARFGTSYAGDKGNRPGHDATIRIENSICAPPTRGVFNNALQGESFHQLPGINARKVFKLVDGWYYQQVS